MDIKDQEIHSTIQDSSDSVKRAVLVYTSYGAYITATALNVEGKDLFLANGKVTLPIVGVESDLVYFFFFAPLIFLAFYIRFYVLYVLHNERVNSILKIEKDSDKANGQKLPLSVFNQRIILQSKNIWLTVGINVSHLLIYRLFPFGVILVILIKFLPYHSRLVTVAHQLSLLIVMTICWFGFYFLRESSFWSKNTKLRKYSSVSLFLVTCSLLVYFFDYPRTIDHNFRKIPFTNIYLNELITRNIDVSDQIIVQSPATTQDIYEYFKSIEFNEDTDDPYYSIDQTTLAYGLIEKGVSVAPRSSERPANIRIGKNNINSRKYYRDFKFADFRGAILRGANLSNSDFSYANFSYTDMRNSTFNHSSFYSANFKHANLDRIKAFYSDMRSTTIGNASVRYSTIFGSLLIDAEIYNTNLFFTSLNSVDAYNSTWIASNLTKVSLVNSNIELSNWMANEYDSSNFDQAKTRGATFSSVEGLRDSQKLFLEKQTFGTAISLEEHVKPELQSTFDILNNISLYNSYNGSTDTFIEVVERFDFLTRALVRIRPIKTPYPILEEWQKKEFFSTQDTLTSDNIVNRYIRLISQEICTKPEYQESFLYNYHISISWALSAWSLSGKDEELLNDIKNTRSNNINFIIENCPELENSFNQKSYVHIKSHILGRPNFSTFSFD